MKGDNGVLQVSAARRCGKICNCWDGFEDLGQTMKPARISKTLSTGPAACRVCEIKHTLFRVAATKWTLGREVSGREGKWRKRQIKGFEIRGHLLMTSCEFQGPNERFWNLGRIWSNIRKGRYHFVLMWGPELRDYPGYLASCTELTHKKDKRCTLINSEGFKIYGGT